VKSLALVVFACALGCSLDKSGIGVDLVLGGDSSIDTAVDTGTPGFLDASIDSNATDTFVPDTFVPETTPADVEPEAPTCKPATGETLCVDIPPFVGAQTVDGDGKDFCEVGGVSWSNVDGDWVVPMVPPDAGKVRVHMKVAWSAAGLHAFVAVDDPVIIVDPGATTLYQGDSIELYLAGFGKLTGKYDTTNDVGAIQIVIAPPNGAAPAHSQIFLTSTPSGPLDSTKYAAVLTASGYAVEVAIPWSDLHGMGIKSGSTVGFDIAVNSKWDAATEHVFSVWRRKVPPMTSCGGDASPSCDDRVWCVPKLD
jgi:hypothetical protein